MLTHRIIPCLDVKGPFVVKGVKFKNHEILGDIIEFAQRYRDQGADEIVFYDISASSERRSVSIDWVKSVANVLDIPFCVAGGIKDLESATRILAAGADKISINTPAIENPNLINELSDEFGCQCIVVGVDSFTHQDGYQVWKYTGDETTATHTHIDTISWVKEVQDRGAGEIVLNCMNQDGVRNGYDIKQLNLIKESTHIPLIASGGAGNKKDFLDLFQKTNVDAALAASVFHKNIFTIGDLKNYLSPYITVRI